MSIPLVDEYYILIPNLDFLLNGRDKVIILNVTEFCVGLSYERIVLIVWMFELIQGTNTPLSITTHRYLNSTRFMVGLRNSEHPDLPSFQIQRA